MRRPLSLFGAAGLCLSLLFFCASSISAQSKVVIADGGASGYLMKHTLPAVAMAVTMDADLIKLDLVLSKDNQVIVFAHPTLEQTTDVAERFPGRARDDGRYHVLDFTLEEIRKLSLHDQEGRFPADLHPRLTIPTLSEELAMIRGLEKTMGRSIPIAPEIKQPWLYRKAGRDISSQVLILLQKYAYGGKEDSTTLLSFDAEELQRIAKDLLPRMQMNIKLIQLIDSKDGGETMVEEWGELNNYNYDWMFSKSGLRSLKRYIAGVGLPKTMLADSNGTLLLPDFIQNLHQLEMLVYAFPAQKEAQATFPAGNSFTQELDFFYFTVGVDGIITDFCGDAVTFLKNRTHHSPSLPEKNEMTAQTGKDPLQLTRPRLPSASFGTESKE